MSVACLSTRSLNRNMIAVRFAIEVSLHPSKAVLAVAIDDLVTGDCKKPGGETSTSVKLSDAFEGGEEHLRGEIFSIGLVAHPRVDVAVKRGDKLPVEQRKIGPVVHRFRHRSLFSNVRQYRCRFGCDWIMHLMSPIANLVLDSILIRIFTGISCEMGKGNNGFGAPTTGEVKSPHRSLCRRMSLDKSPAAHAWCHAAAQLVDRRTLEPAHD